MRTQRTFPTGPRPRFPGQFLWYLCRDPLHFLRNLVPADSPIVGFGKGRYRFVVLQQPELIHKVLVSDAANYRKGRGLQIARRMLGDGLLTSEGELHRRQRQLLQPVLQARKVERFGSQILGWTGRLLQSWPERGTISAPAEMSRLTLQIVGDTLLGTALEEEVSEVRAALEEALHLFRLANVPLLATLFRRRFERSRSRLDRVVLRMIAQHHATPQADLLGRMLECPHMSEGLLRDETMTMFLAGHETTAHALTFALYLLSRDPRRQAAIRAELPRDRPLTARDTCPLLRNALLETLRLYPPGWMLGRQAIQETELGAHHIPAGCTVLASPYTMHRRAEYFPDPERFRPERWETRPRTSLPRGCFFPFGAGPRVCIGEHFAWLEMVLGLGRILQLYHLDPCPVEQPRLRPGITLAPAHDLAIPVRRLR